MRKLVLTFVFVSILLDSVQAQIVLNPPDAVGHGASTQLTLFCYISPNSCVQYHTFVWYFFYPIANAGSAFEVRVSSSSWPGGSHALFDSHCTLPTYYSDYGIDHQLHCNEFYLGGYLSAAVLEFDISGLSGSGGVTPENFQSATLGSLQVIMSSGQSQFGLYINDLYDINEDGVITNGEATRYWPGSVPISLICSNRPPVGTVFQNIDVTAAVYNDLFGTGSGEDFSGFSVVLDWWSPDLHDYLVVFNRYTPTLTITIDHPIPSLSPYGLLLLGLVFSLYAILKLNRD